MCVTFISDVTFKVWSFPWKCTHPPGGQQNICQPKERGRPWKADISPLLFLGSKWWLAFLIKWTQIFWTTPLKGGSGTFSAHNGPLRGCPLVLYGLLLTCNQPKPRCLSGSPRGAEASNWSHLGDRQGIMGHSVLTRHTIALNLSGVQVWGSSPPGAGAGMWWGWELLITHLPKAAL